jgi:hypothetical protein
VGDHESNPAHREERDERGTASSLSVDIFTTLDRATGPVNGYRQLPQIKITAMKKEEKNLRIAREARRFEAEQRNAEFTANLLRVNSDYGPLWSFPPRAPLVWRLGAGVLGALFLFAGGCSFFIGLQSHSWAALGVSIFLVLISMRPLWNAFKRQTNERVLDKNSTHKHGSP